MSTAQSVNIKYSIKWCDRTKKDCNPFKPYYKFKPKGDSLVYIARATV